MSTTTSNDNNPQLEALLDYVKHSRGFNFTGYKRSSLMRRIEKRMQTANVGSYEDYTDYLEVHPEEFARLFDTVLINVTHFFRDPAAWDYVADDIIPRIIEGKKASDPIRVWSAGCASGEEAYTAAMLLGEALGKDQFRERVKIYASDVDEDALTQARQASYTSREVSNIPPKLLEKYFEPTNHHFIFEKDLRRSVIFGRHDLTQDAPISRIDLLICRNTLMYFNSEMQSRILTRFHFALNDTGYLFLGKAEMLFAHGNLFTAVDIRPRVFTKVPRVTLRERLMLLNQADHEEVADQSTAQVRFRDSVFESGSVAQIVLDLKGIVALINQQARSLLGLTPKDLNRPLADLDLSHRITDLLPRIEASSIENIPLTLKEVDWVTKSGEVRTLEVQVSPLAETANGIVIGTSVIFTDVSRYKHLQDELEHSNQELETAYEELQSTNEELETTNEELQSTVEEMETTNEELQSTNEELETINEELQSTNEELHTVNEELRRRTNELNQANSFLESILTSMRGGVVVVDRNFQVQIWNYKAEDLWGLRSNEVLEKNFLNLDSGLPVEKLRDPIRACLSDEADYQEVILDAVNRRGKKIQCKVTCTPLRGNPEKVRGVILVMEDVDSQKG